jgi:hypothetical protein
VRQGAAVVERSKVRRLGWDLTEAHGAATAWVGSRASAGSGGGLAGLGG